MIKPGDRFPDTNFLVKDADGNAKSISTDELFDGRTVVLVGVPGAFTRTCHGDHVPQFVESAEHIGAKGADLIAVMAVNDHHVMREWSKALDGGGRLDFLADGTAEVTKAIGMDVDMSAGGLGVRCRRFSMIVEDGVVKVVNLEPEGRKGVTATGAATILEQL